jgi:hypothetical protein
MSDLLHSSEYEKWLDSRAPVGSGDEEETD